MPFSNTDYGQYPTQLQNVLFIPSEAVHLIFVFQATCQEKGSFKTTAPRFTRLVTKMSHYSSSVRGVAKRQFQL